jgi:large repetitive protein
LTFTAITSVPASEGVLVLNTNGTYTFTPAANFNGTVVVDYKVCDATLCDTATLTFTVNAVNDAPVAANDYAPTLEDTPVSGTVATNDIDVEGGILTYSSITSVPVSQGILVFNSNGTFTFTPTVSFNGIVSVSYKVCDAGGLCDTAILNVNVGGINNAPVAVNDAISTNEEVATVGTVATNDSDVDNLNSELTYTAITIVPASQGVFVLNANGGYTFTPAANFNGTVTVDYKVCDPSNACDTARLVITVNAVNDAPVAVNDGVTTPENTTVTNTVASNDSDTEGDALTYTAITSVPASQGVLTLNNNGTYTFVPAANFNGVVTVDYKVCDATLCDTATLTINVSSVNNAPVAVNDAKTTNEDVAVTGTVATNDSDVDNLNSELTYNAITIVPASQGVLVLNANGGYTFTPAANFNGTVTVDYKVCDPSNACDTARLTITVNAVNDAPVAINDSKSTPEDISTSGTVATNDSDIENDPLTYSAITGVPASQGVLTLNTNGTYTFVPATNFNGVVTIDYKVCDATLCDTATLTISVSPVNDAPVALNDAVTTLENASISNSVATNDSDTEGDVLSFTAITSVPSSQGVLVLNANGVYTFIPAANFNGVVTVDYKVCDPSGACDTATLTINITSVNNAPVAVNDAETTNEDIAISSTVATNDSDVEGDLLTFTTIGGVSASQGILVLNSNGTYTFTPAPNFNGLVSVDYKVCDLIGACDTATLTITVNAVNDAPVAVNDANTTPEDTAVSSTVATNDSDVEGGVLTYTTITSVPASQGVLVLNANGGYTFTPAANFNGVVNVDYKVCDTNGACDTATLSITVSAVNDAPVAINDAITSPEDVPAIGTVATNDSDVENSPLTYTAITSVPASQGVLVFNTDGTFVFTPAPNFNGVVNIDYQVCDPTGACDTARLAINVSSVNDAPVAENDVNSTPEDTAVSSTVATNDSDTEGDVLSFTAISSVSLSQGVLILNANGGYTFTPAANFNGTVTVDYKVCDPSGACDTATLTINVIPVNDAPVAVNDANLTNEDTNVSGTVGSNDSDTEGAALTFTTITNATVSQGIFVLNSNGTYTFAPAANFNGTVSIDYKVCDLIGACDTATLTITVSPVNDTPLATSDAVTTLENVLVSSTVAPNDSDVDNLNSQLTYTAITGVPVSEGVLILNSNGSYTFTPALNFNGVVNVDYKVCDPSNACDTATLTINITSVNNAPIAVNDAETTNEDTAISSTVATNDSDVEGNALTFTTIGSVSASQGILVLNADGTYTFTPAPNFSGVVNVDYKVCDFIGACDTATLTITVNALNDAPLATNDANYF